MRAFWLAWGNIALVICAAVVLKTRPWTIGIADVVYWALVIGILAARYVDIARCRGWTVNWEPATMRHFAVHAAKLVPLAGVVWVLAQSVQL